MKSLFDWASPATRFLNTVADLFLLNILTLICSIPLFTIGAAQTAMYDVIGRMTRGDPYAIWKDYWRGFKSNFKQATVLWLLFLVSGLLLGFSLWFYLVRGSEFSRILVILVGILCVFWLGALSWVFPLQSRFDNPMKHTIHNALYCAVFQFPKTVIATSCGILPWVLLVTEFAWFLRLGLLWLLLWPALTAYITMQLYKKPFSMIVDQ